MIIKTYQCSECFHRMEMTLTADQWDNPPPNCAICEARTNQEFQPPAIGGSVRARAARIAEDIAANDYGVANINFEHREGGTPTVRYKGQTASAMPAQWQGHRELLEQAISIGKQNRRDFGLDGLDILKRNIMSGDQPDLIEASKRRAIKVY